MGHRHDHSHCVKDALAQVERVCAERGLRLTETRRAVLKLIWQGHKALSAAEIMHKLKNDKPPVTYRALEFLQQNGFIHKVASLNAYIGCPHPDEAHASQLLVCGDCREVVEVSSAPLDRQVENEAHKHHFEVTHRHLEVVGRCADCRDKA